MRHKIVPAIMSGGSGTRLWPLSTSDRPKQFHAMAGSRSMIQETALRLVGALGEVEFAPPVIIGNAGQADLIVSELRAAGVEPAEVILEPVGRNTAATAALAAAAVRQIDREAMALLLPADHVIADEQGFRAAVARAAPFARERIVTFGIVADRPETGYGYIEAGDALGESVFAISSFKEKPNADTAAGYLAAGGYYWNAGIFLFNPAIMLQELAASPEIRDGALAAYETAKRENVLAWLGESFAAVPSLPVDIAVMERTKLGAVAPCDIGWADVGSWSELWRLSAAADTDNVTKGDVVAMDCAGSLMWGDGVTVAAAGVHDLIIVATKDAVLVLPKDRAQDVKKLWEAVHKK